jgi:hypothetical protein
MTGSVLGLSSDKIKYGLVLYYAMEFVARQIIERMNVSSGIVVVQIIA